VSGGHDSDCHCWGVWRRRLFPITWGDLVYSSLHTFATSVTAVLRRAVAKSSETVCVEIATSINSRAPRRNDGGGGGGSTRPQEGGACANKNQVYCCLVNRVRRSKPPPPCVRSFVRSSSSLFVHKLAVSLHRRGGSSVSILRVVGWGEGQRSPGEGWPIIVPDKQFVDHRLHLWSNMRFLT